MMHDVSQLVLRAIVKALAAVFGSPANQNCDRSGWMCVGCMQLMYAQLLLLQLLSAGEAYYCNIGLLIIKRFLQLHKPACSSCREFPAGL